MTAAPKPIREYLTRELEWVQPSMFKWEYELRVGSEVVATLRLRGVLCSNALAHSADGTWIMKRTGAFRHRVTVREEGSSTDLAVFTERTFKRGGTLELADGRTYRTSTNFWHTRYRIETERERSLLEFRSRGVFRQSGRLEVAREAAGLAELPWLILLGWFLVVLMQHDSSASAGG